MLVITDNSTIGEDPFKGAQGTEGHRMVPIMETVDSLVIRIMATQEVCLIIWFPFATALTAGITTRVLREDTTGGATNL